MSAVQMTRRVVVTAAVAIALIVSPTRADGRRPSRPGWRPSPAGRSDSGHRGSGRAATDGRSAPDAVDRPYVAAATTYDSPADGGRYAAIAYAPSSGRHGYAFGHRSRAEAESRALDECGGGDARIVVWARNGWCALALGAETGRYGWGWGSTSQRARESALADCAQRTSGCYIAASVYSGN
jgi:hypothetical protein